MLERGGLGFGLEIGEWSLVWGIESGLGGGFNDTEGLRGWWDGGCIRWCLIYFYPVWQRYHSVPRFLADVALYEK